jgi:hypothetical protein
MSEVQTQEEKMIARVWHGYTLPQHADAYEAMLKPELLPGVGKAQDIVGAIFSGAILEARLSSSP